VSPRNSLVVAAAAVLAGLALPQPAEALTFGRCPGAPGIQCGTLDVPLDPAGRVPGSLRLHVERVPARKPARPPLFVLEGGPGASVTAFARGYGELFRRQRADRDLILVDQRGTGLSGALRCPGLRIPDSKPALGQAGAAARCAARLGPAAAFYTTRASAADLDAVRAAIGAERIALYGSSYGTKLELAYAVLYPSRVDRMVLDSVVPLDEAGFDPDSFRAVARVLDKLCATGCEGITNDPVADTARLVAKMRARGALKGRVVDTRGRVRTGRIGRLRLATLLFSGDYASILRAAYPAAVRSALAGDLSPLLRLAGWAERGSQPVPPREFSDAMHTANECQEGPFLWDRSAPFSDRLAQARARMAGVPASELHPFDRDTALSASEIAQLCWQWPSADPPLPTGPLPAVPALLLAGEDDLRTPVEGAERVARAIPGARVLTVPGVGHGVYPGASRCPGRAVEDLLAERPPRPCKPGTEPPYAIPAAPLSPRELPPASGNRGLPGRTLTAVRLTLVDVDEALTTAVYSDRGFARVGGLRAGWAHDHWSPRVRHPRISLHGYSYVRGVRVTGRIDGLIRRHGKLRVTGRAAARGTLTLHRDESLTGRLGGRRVG
jgi:pimeloyl-ACP methyl ester carboxylesterase